MEKEKTIFIIGVQAGIELRNISEKEREELGKKHFTMLDWETDWINNIYNEIKIKHPELFDAKK